MGVDTKETELFIEGPTGRLEMKIQYNLGPENEKGLIGVICHPHPLYQGSMDNKVVTTIARAWQNLGLSTVRFNFRGVGSSEGHYAEGVGETEDLVAVLHWLQATYPKASFWLGGFSFGSLIASKVASLSLFPIQALLIVAPPVEHFPPILNALPKIPWIIIQGDKDEIVAYQAVLNWYESIKKIVPETQFITLKEASHFFHGRLLELKSDIIQKMQPLLPP